MFRKYIIYSSNEVKAELECITLEQITCTVFSHYNQPHCSDQNYHEVISWTSFKNLTKKNSSWPENYH